ncbi:MAG TPA: signal peptidase II [Patescibacteria group bacterium]
MAYRRLIFFTGLVLLDQISKWQADNLGLVVWNRGVSFGWGQIYFSPLMLAVGGGLLLFFVWGLSQRAEQKNPLGMSLFLAGAASNLIDRVYFGAVRDWLSIPLIGLTNNLADWMIVIGLMLWLVALAKSAPRS